MPESSKTPSLVDGVTSAPAPAQILPRPKERDVQQKKRLLVTLGGIVYGAYALWCLALITMLPSVDPALIPLKNAGVLTSLAGGGVLLIVGVLLLQRVMRPALQPAVRQRGLIRLLVTLVPGFIFSCITLFVILQQPALPMDIVSPQDAASLVAPLAVTFSMERSVELLRKMGRAVIKYEWFTDGTGKSTENSVNPVTTAIFKRAGSYNIGVRLTLDDGTLRRVTRSLLIPVEVFSLTPDPPVVKKIVKFSVAHLLVDPKQLVQVQWDFDGDGKTDETAKVPDIDHVFYAVGSYRVSALIDMQNQTQKSYQRDVLVQSPPPLPFPLTLKTDLKKLVGPAPFGVVFSVDTQEPLQELSWDFGDGEQQAGVELRRAGHTFKTPGTYGVTLRARSASGGKLAEVSSVVRVTPELAMNDLRFEGQPDVQNDTVSGEVPLNVVLSPKTSLPLIQFSWDYPEDIAASVDGTAFKGIFRKEGKYNITLIAEDPSGSSRRTTLFIDVRPSAAEPSIGMQPEGGMAPLHVVFDASNTFIPQGEKIAGYKWLFGDEKNARAVPGGSRVEHTYEAAGEYKVRLMLVTTGGKESSAERTIIIRGAILSACATASRLTLAAGGSVKFDASCSTGELASTLWDVRRSDRPEVILAQSDTPQYVNVFDQPGTYTVNLTVQSKDGETDTRSLIISVTP